MNDLQQRLLTVLENIGGIGKTAELQQRGNIAKSIEVIECNLAGLMRLKLIGQKGTLWILGKHLPVEKKKKTRILAMLASLFNYVPLVNIFAPVFAQILFLHHILAEEQV